MIQLEEGFNLESLRQRLRRMDDALLLRWGRAAAELSGQREVFRLAGGSRTRGMAPAAVSSRQGRR
jgi:hypothetical protein